mgnify:CR=1 FL=1
MCFPVPAGVYTAPSATSLMTSSPHHLTKTDMSTDDCTEFCLQESLVDERLYAIIFNETECYCHADVDLELNDS